MVGTGAVTAQRNPTPAERDERVRIDADPEDALKILLGSLNDPELDPNGSSAAFGANVTLAGSKNQ